MGLTGQSTGVNILRENILPGRESADDLVIALAGNPNVGKSTVFNSLTGLNQHTGNWPGKTVTNARGRCRHKDKNFVLVDIPGTYSLMASSVEEEVARDFICFGKPDATIVVADATCLERNLNLILQVLEITDRVIVCLNLMDEAERKQIKIDLQKLSDRLGVPVIGASARNGRGLTELMDAVYRVTGSSLPARPLRVAYNGIIEDAINLIQPYVDKHVGGEISSRWISLKLLDDDRSVLSALNDYLGYELIKDRVIARQVSRAKKYLRNNNIGVNDFRDMVVSGIVKLGEDLYNDTVTIERKNYDSFDRKLDMILTSKLSGIPVMLLLLGFVFWLTLTGANYPSEMIAGFLFWIEEHLSDLLLGAGAPLWLHGLFVEGMYRTLAWVISVMLPPMAIFFPLFTILEDSGYLPRIAFNLDNFFKKACAHGKQALTMCMGFGCNAAGVIGCRIIDSPRERLIAIITNNFVPCNGRFPTLIAISSIFIGGIVTGTARTVVSTITLMTVIVLGVVMTLAVSRILSKTILQGMPSSFTLELPPYRRPLVGRIIIRSVFDRTMFVLGRAVAVAAPAGMVIWSLANVTVNGASLLAHGAAFLDPFARLLGMDGYILMAFIIGLPANEIVIPIIIMSYMATGSLQELNSLQALRQLLVSHGWTWLTAVCVMLFSLMHFPCATTLWTIRKETRSTKWTLVSFMVPTIAGVLSCLVVAQGARLLGLA